MSEMKNYIETMKEQLAENLMVLHGWPLEEKDKYPLEWDANRDDSQYSMMYEDASFAVDNILQMLKDVDVPEDFEDDEEDFEEQERKTVTSSAAMFIFMDAGIGNPAYVKDVRQWLAKVDAARLPDDTEVEGTLHLSYDVDLENLERIECMECGEKDLLLTIHKCSTHE